MDNKGAAMENIDTKVLKSERGCCIWRKERWPGFQREQWKTGMS